MSNYNNGNVSKIKDNVFVINSMSEFSIGRGTGAPNTTIIEDEDNLLIIDPGVWTYNLKVVKKSKLLSSLLRKKSEIIIFYTHQHWDHVLAGHYYQTNYKITAYANEKEKEAIENKDVMHNLFSNYKILKDELYSPNWIMKGILRYIWGKYKPLHVDRVITREGENIGDSLEVKTVLTPGHTPGLTGLYIPEFKIYVAGDLIDLDSGVTIDINSPISSYSEGLESLKKISEFDIETFITGHGPITFGKKECKELFERRIKKSQEVFNLIHQQLETKSISFKELVFTSFPETKNSIRRYNLQKYVVFAYLNDINEKEGLEIEKKGSKTLISL